LSDCGSFDPVCRRCPRLAGFLDEVKVKYPDYFAAPVPAFGDKNPKLLIVGLAPGMHGANRTGRPFTGDYAGILLYNTLYELGCSNIQGTDDPNDGLELKGVRISNAVKCLPPQNKPETSEIRECNSFIASEIKALPKGSNIFALGLIAHQAVLRAYDLKLGELKFAHGAVHQLPDGRKLYDSYHCSRYNTQTKRLTEAMFKDVMERAVSG